jgi:ABC-type dipeptide/oligopeptide/nickel transport system permease component
MTSYIATRLFLATLTVLGVVTVVFVALRMIPGDPAALVAGIQASPAQIEDIRRQLGLDQPAPIQYGRYITGVLRGDFGDSSVTGQPVVAEIGARFPYTVQLTLLAILMSTFFGILLGTIAAARRNSWIDVGISTVSVLGISMPVYWLGLMLIIVFAVNLRVLPAGGSREATSIVLPAVALAAYSTGLIARMTRASVLDELAEDYVRTAKAKGATYARQLVRHALRNALLPVITVIGLQAGQLLGGAVLTETVFSWPGMGRLLVSSILNRDYAVVQGIVLLFAVGFVVVNLVVDLAYGLADPRIRLATR